MKHLSTCCIGLLALILLTAPRVLPAAPPTAVEKPAMARAASRDAATTEDAGSEQTQPARENTAPPVDRLLTRNQPSFFDPAYYRQFDAGLLASLGASVSGLNLLPAEFWQGQGVLVLLHVLLAGILTGLLRSRRQAHAAEAEKPPLLRHPLAAGLFASTALLTPCYRHPPAGWLLILAAVGVLSAVPLVNELFAHPLQRLSVRLLAIAFVLSLALETLALPEPLNGLYVAGLCLAGILVLRGLAARSRKIAPDRQRHYRGLLKTLKVLLALIFLAQAGGYGILAGYLLHAGFKTLFACLLAGLATHLLHSWTLSLAGLKVFARPGFFHRHGRELLKRLRHLATLAIFVLTGLYLTVAWRLFDTVGAAWHGIVTAGFTLNGMTVSAKMLLTGLATLYLAVLFSWLMRSLLEEEVFPHRQIDRGVRDSINKLLHYALLTLGVLMALSLTGIDLKNFAVLAGALGIGIGFGLQNIVNNFVSGLILLFERPIKNGDMIVLDGDWGEVRKIGLRSTTIETFDQAEVIVPNSILVSEKVTNWTLTSEQCRIVVPVGVAYGSDIEKVLQILYEAARQHPEVLDTPPPSAIFTSFGASSLDFELRVWARSVSHRLLIKSDLLLFIDRRFREAGVEIPFPQRDLHLRSVDDKVFQGWKTAEAPPPSADNP